MRTKLLAALLTVASTVSLAESLTDAVPDAVPQHELSPHNPFDFSKTKFVGAGASFTWSYSCNDGVGVQGIYVVEAGSLESEKVIEKAYIRKGDDICNLVYAVDPLDENRNGWDMSSPKMSLIMQHVRGLSKLTKAPAFIVPIINPKNEDRYLKSGTTLEGISNDQYNRAVRVNYSHGYEDAWAACEGNVTENNGYKVKDFFREGSRFNTRWFDHWDD